MDDVAIRVAFGVVAASLLAAAAGLAILAHDIKRLRQELPQMPRPPQSPQSQPPTGG